MDLRVERTRARLTIKQVATAAGLTRQTIWRWESQAEVLEADAARHRAAVARLMEATA